jgi:hypothetical protein
LGQWFFSRFDYVPDLRGKRLEFRKQDPTGSAPGFGRSAAGHRSEPGVDGLAPVGLFKAIYVCNPEGYVVFE